MQILFLAALAAQAQGTVRGAERGAAQGERDPSVLSWAAPSARLPALSAAFSVSRIARASAPTSSNSACHPTVMKATSA
jgi:hypothetical protein